MRHVTLRGRIATEPFPDMSVKTATVGTGPVKVARIENKSSLVPLRVVMDCEDGRFHVGDMVLVKGSNYTALWAKEIHDTVDGIKYILIPEAFVEVVRKYE